MSEGGVTDLPQILASGQLGTQPLHYKNTGSKFAVWVANPVGKSLPIEQLELAVGKTQNPVPVRIGISTSKRFTDWTPAYAQAYTVNLPDAEIGYARVPAEINGAILTVPLTDAHLNLPEQGAWIVIEVSAEVAPTSSQRLELGYFYSLAEEYSVYNPQHGWINLNHQFKRDYTEVLKRETPRKILQMPAFRLKVHGGRK